MSREDYWVPEVETVDKAQPLINNQYHLSLPEICVISHYVTLSFQAFLSSKICFKIK